MEYYVWLLIHKDIVGNADEFYCMNERVAFSALKLNTRYKLKVVQEYAQMCSHDDKGEY